VSLDKAILNAVRKGTAKWAKQRKAEERHAAAAFNRRMRLLSTRRLTIKDIAYEVMERAYMAASDNGRLPATATQIMYAARGEIQERTGKQLDRQYFNQTLLPDYIAEHPSAVSWNVVYDERGHFTEPHTEKSFGLGTLAVREYLSKVGKPEYVEPSVTKGGIRTRGPKHRYGAILYIEKEGFLPLFERVQLQERYDIALMSNKGLSVTATRELVDFLSKDVPVFVAHDFDKAGFSIIGTLGRSGRRYFFQQNPRVIDLGLRLADIADLQDEDVFDRGRESVRRANLRENGATREEIEFLLHRRVELNAMTSRQLVTWIERKLAEHGVRKIVPDDETLARAYRANVRSNKIAEAIAEIIKNEPAIDVPTELADKVRALLEKCPSASWDDAVAKLAEPS
jgi:hypothetical protein